LTKQISCARVSPEQLNRYCGEFSFRWNHRKVTDGQRTEEAIKGMVGKRLVYKEVKEKETG
jgi:hypothetical protein